jgi:hypothetical protein
LEACGKVTDKSDLLAVFPEHNVKETKISSTLAVHGSVDYVIADTKNKGELRLGGLRDGDELARVPHFCVVEAKKDKGFVEGRLCCSFLTSAGRYQTLAEMKAIWSLAKDGAKTHVNGVLSDGIRWSFYQLHADGSKYSRSKPLSHPEHSATIIATLRAFIRGAEPPPAFDDEGDKF